MKRNRVIAGAGAAILAACTILAAVVSCTAPFRVDETQYLGRACEAPTDCPFYLTCVEKKCLHRCLPNNTCPGGETCREGACFTGSNPQNPSSPTGTFTSECSKTITPVRRDVPVSPSTSAQWAFDSTHVYVAGTASDSLGNPRPGIYAAALDSGGSFRNIYTPPASSSGGPPLVAVSLARAGNWLYFKDSTANGNIQRLPVPTPEPAPAPEDLGTSGGIVAATSTNLIIANSGGTPPDGGAGGGSVFTRMDGTTGALESNALDLIPAGAGGFTPVAITPSRLFWVFPKNSGSSSTTGAAQDEIVSTTIDSGAAIATGVFLPAGTQLTSFAAGGDYVYMTTPNGTILRVDTTMRGSMPTTVRGPGSNLGVLDDSYEYSVVRPPNEYTCVQLQRVSLATSATQKMAAVPGTGVAVVGFTSTSVFVRDLYGNTKDLYRIPKF